MQRPNEVIPSHGLFAILKMIEEKKTERLISFLESDYLEPAMTAFIKELNRLTAIDNSHLETLNLNRKDEPREKVLEKTSYVVPEIHGRSYIMALHIYYLLYRSEEEYFELKKSTPEFIERIKSIFKVDKLPQKISKDKNFDFKLIIKSAGGTKKGQLRRQFEQITNNQEIFGEPIVTYVKQILKDYYSNNNL